MEKKKEICFLFILSASWWCFCHLLSLLLLFCQSVCMYNVYFRSCTYDLSVFSSVFILLFWTVQHPVFSRVLCFQSVCPSMRLSVCRFLFFSILIGRVCMVVFTSFLQCTCVNASVCIIVCILVLICVSGSYTLVDTYHVCEKYLCMLIQQLYCFWPLENSTHILKTRMHPPLREQATYVHSYHNLNPQHPTTTVGVCGCSTTRVLLLFLFLLLMLLLLLVGCLYVSQSIFICCYGYSCCYIIFSTCHFIEVVW